MPAIPPPPADGSGGYLVLQVTNGTDTHRLRVHVAPFLYGSGINFNYSPVVGSGAEASVLDTAGAVMDQVKAFYNNAWTLSLLSVFQIVGGSPVERFGWAVPSTRTGTSSAATPNDQSRAVMLNYNGKSALGGRFRLSLIGCANARAQFAVQPAYTVTNSTDPSGWTLLSYMAGANSGARCHDGQAFTTGNCRATYVTNKKLRRRYGYS